MPEISLFNYNKKFIEIDDETRKLAESLLQPGDIILVKTPTFFNSKLRIIANAPYDHCVVVMDSSMTCLEISYPEAKLVEVWAFVNPNRKPLIIRPQMNDQQKEEFLNK